MTPRSTGQSSATRFALVAAETEEAQEALGRLGARYATVPFEEAEIIVALGGDGLMLETLHASIERCPPIYGMNRGTVGFLMNEFAEDDLPARLARAEQVTLHPLRMKTRAADGSETEALAINEVSLLREGRQSAHIRISVDGEVQLEELIGDGALVATPAGSSAYNFSAHGPIVPLGAQLLVLTPLNPFRPRRWRSVLLPNSAEIAFEVLNAAKRPVSATADYTEVREVTRVEVREAPGVSLHLLFDPEHNLERRLLREQFLP
ncbi:MAG: NAD kinase [Rhodospirillales bacterium]|nr:NAD kinase [Rhodospirillales bacterium]